MPGGRLRAAVLPCTWRACAAVTRKPPKMLIDARTRAMKPNARAQSGPSRARRPTTRRRPGARRQRSPTRSRWSPTSAACAGPASPTRPRSSRRRSPARRSRGGTRTDRSRRPWSHGAAPAAASATWSARAARRRPPAAPRRPRRGPCSRTCSGVSAIVLASLGDCRAQAGRCGRDRRRGRRRLEVGWTTAPSRVRQRRLDELVVPVRLDDLLSPCRSASRRRHRGSSRRAPRRWRRGGPAR